MQRRLSARAYIAIYAYMQGIYTYMEPGKHIYRSYIYVFHVYLCVFVQISCCIHANECNLMQTYALLHITFCVICRVGNVSYILDLCDYINSMHPTFYISLLQMYPVGGATLGPLDPIVTAGAEEEYGVESILRHRWWE